MELKEGMYVRIKNKVGYCVIGKIENINNFREPSMKYCIDIQSDDFIFIPEDMITKASYNIIDLIEVGDYVNRLEVIEVRQHLHNDKEIVLSNGEFQWSFSKDESDYEIKSIVTKEQFEAIKYEVK